MNFKSEQDIKRLRSLEHYLKHIKDDHFKGIITKRLKAIFLMTSGLDSQPMDAYRIIGVATVKVMQLEEINKLIMEHTTSYSVIIPWARELYEVWMHNHKLKAYAIDMVLSLKSQGITDGFYTPESTEKEVTP